MVDVSIVIRGEVWLQELVQEALEGAKCVLGALQFGNDPGFSKHDWHCDDYTDSVLFPLSLLSPTPPTVSSPTCF